MARCEAVSAEPVGIFIISQAVCVLPAPSACWPSPMDACFGRQTPATTRPHGSSHAVPWKKEPKKIWTTSWICRLRTGSAGRRPACRTEEQMQAALKDPDREKYRPGQMDFASASEDGSSDEDADSEEEVGAGLLGVGALGLGLGC